MLNFLYKSRIRIIFSAFIILLGIFLLLQGIIGVYYAYESKISSQKMASLIIDNDALNLTALLNRVDSLINLLESDEEYLFNPADSVTYDIIADSKTFNAMNQKIKTLLETNITDVAYNNSFLFLPDTLPITYVAPEYETIFDISLHSNSFGIYATNSIKTSEWFKNMKDSVDAYIWIENAFDRKILCFAQNIYQKTLVGSDVTIRTIGVFYISFDLTSLLNQLKLSELYPNSSFTLSYKEDVIYSNSSEDVSNNFKDFTYTSSLYPGLTLHTHIPENNINSSYKIQFFMTVIMLTLLLILSGILFIYIYSCIISPIERMTEYLLKKEKIQILPHQKMAPEIAILYQSHNIMIDRVNEAMIKSKKSYYKMLQSQINPHFTYNVLNSISAISLAKGDFEISETIYNLVEMLRYGINKPEDMVSLSEELAISEKFVAIQNFRFKKDVIMEYNIPENLPDIRMPKLTIQPLIENSIFHSDTSLNDEDIYIKVNVSADKDVAVITISDSNNANADLLS